jgi:hypothetical protein
MSALDDRRRLEELYLPPADEFVLVDVPDLQFVMIDGEGNPSGEAFAQASRWLFSVVFPIKRVAKERMGKSFVEPPLEGLWWADDMNDLIAGNRDKLKWRLMIVTADWVDEELFVQAMAKASERLGEPPRSLRREGSPKGRVCRSCMSAPIARKSRPSPASTTSSCGARPHPQRALPRDLLDGSEPRNAREAQDGATPASRTPGVGASASAAASRQWPVVGGLVPSANE